MVAENLCMGCMREIGPEKQCPYCGFHADTPQITPYLPMRTVISERYVIGRVLSAGGDGVTYIGWDLQSSVPVSIREYLPDRFISRQYESAQIAVKPEFAGVFDRGLQTFLDMWRKLARGRELQGLIPVLDIFEQNGTAYAVSEYIETITLRDFLLKSRTGTIPWDRLKNILMPLLTTVSTLHTMGVYHLGISPNSLVLGRDGKLRLTDFMINESRCQNTDFDCELASGYAAVEQYAYLEDTGPWSDVYALAGVIYRALVGSTPVEATERITNDKLMIPPKVAETLSAYLISALDHAIMVEPAERTDSIDLFREELSGSPSTMAAKNMSAVSTTEEELAERKRLEKIALQEQNRQRQIKITVISFLVVLIIGAICAGVYFMTQKSGKDGESASANQTADGSDVSGETIAVPNFVGEVCSRITENPVQKQRFKMIVEYEYSDDVEQGVIIGQSIEKDTVVEMGTEIVFRVSKGKEQIAVPEVVGMPYEEALKALTQAGFNCESGEKKNDGTHTEGIVASITPDAGTIEDKGTTVIVQVWGPAPEAETEPEETTTAFSVESGLIDAVDLLNEIFN